MRAVAENVQITKRHGHDVVVVVSAMGKATDNLIALAGQVSTTRPGREMDMLLTTGERVSAALLTMALADLGVRRRQLHRQPGRHHHRHRARQGQDRRGQGRPRAPGAGRRQGRRRRRVPGRQHRQGDHDDGPGRVRPHGVGAGQGPRRRRLRDLHRRHRRVLGRPPHRPAGPQARPDQLRRDARDGRGRVQGAGAALGRVRPQPRRRAARPLGVHVGARHVGHRRTGRDRRQAPGGSMEDPIISGVVTDSSESKVTVLGVPDRPGISAAPVRAARRGQRQRRHDRAEHVDRRHDRHQLHGAVGRHGRRRGDRAAASPRRSAPPA